MIDDPQAIVVGAGPAGATAARTLALGGMRVALLDRARFPRHKPCGGALSTRVIKRFPYLERALDRIPTHRVSRLRLEGPAGGHVDLTSESPAALLVRRIEFDRLLVRLAQEAGAALVEGAEVTRAAMDERGVTLTSRDGRVWRAPFVVAADSVNSVIARRLGLGGAWPPGAVALDMMEETRHDRLAPRYPDTLWVAYGHRGSDGYAYVFPKVDHVNVGIGFLLSYYREVVARPPYEVQSAFVGELVRRGVLEGNSERSTFTPFLIPVGGPRQVTASGRVLLAGDAGGFVHAVTAEGIYFAMVTGHLAAEAVLAHPRTASLAGYERAWQREIGLELRESVAVQRYLFADPARIDAMVGGAGANPGLAALVGAYATGQLSYRAVRRRFALRRPFLALKIRQSFVY
jgi:geranylgeranyl reductase family protein